MIKWALDNIIRCAIILVLGGFLVPDPVCFAGQQENSPDKGADDKVSGKDVEVSVFPSKEEAEKLSEKIRASGFETYVREHKAEDGKTVFGVFVVIHTESPQGQKRPSSAGTVETERPIGTKRTPIETLLSSARYFHEGLTVTEAYTDNAFNTKTGKKSDLSTILSAQVSTSWPPVNKKPEGLNLINPQSVGGLSLSRQSGETTRRYQAFLSYQTDIPVHSQNSPSGNTVTHNLQGGFAYNFPGGLSIAVNDEFSRFYSTTDTAVLVAPGEVDKYNSNVIYALLAYDTGNRLKFRFDYSHFLVSYDAQRNASRDRADDTFSTYLYYKLQPKTSLFLEYSFADSGFANDSTLDSKTHDFFAGVEWKITAKSTGSVKAGYSLRNSADSAGNSRNFVFEGQLDHKFTPKTSLTVTASRRIDATDIPSTFYVLTNEFNLQYQQMLTSKITGSLALGYTRESYGADLTFGALTAKKKDNLYTFSPGFQYAFRRWLTSGISYVHTIRDSNFSDFSYSSNTVLLTVTGSL